VKDRLNGKISGHINEATKASIGAGAVSSGAVAAYIPLKDIELSSRLYNNSEYVSKQASKVINKHIETKGTIEELRKKLYEGYELNEEEILDIKHKLPKYLQKGLTEKKLAGLKTKELKAAYLAVLDAKNDKQLKKALKNALYEKARYYARRLAITEEQRAYILKEAAAALEKGVKYVRWTLSPAHKITCICDYYASVNTGHGDGVYPINDAPIPIYSSHPFCMCTLVEVEDPRRWRKADKPFESALEKFSKKDQKKIVSGIKYSEKKTVGDIFV
jgi:hypothetical protein